MASEDSPDWRAEIAAAVAAGRLALDEAKIVLGLRERADGTLVAANPRYRALVREILTAVEIDLEAEIAVEKPAASAPRAGPRAPERPRKRRSRRKRTQPPSQPRASRAAAQAAQATPSKPAKTPDERRIAWAWANEDEAAGLIRTNSHPLLRRLAEKADLPPTNEHPGFQLLDRYPALPQFLFLLQPDKPSRALLRTAEELDLLSHVVERYRPNGRENPILSAAVAGSPAVHVREDRLPATPAKPGPLQTALPFVPDTPEHVLPVYLLNTNRSLLEHGGNRAVPLPWRFWYEALLSAPIGAYGSEAVIAPTVADLVAFAGWARFQRYRHIPELAQALEALDRMAIPYRGTAWRPVLVRNIPASDEIHLDTIIEFSIKLPPGSRQGPQIDRQALRSLAPRSFPRYRGLLGLSAYWDRYGRGRGGADATADNPEADRWPVLTPETLRLILFPDDSPNPRTVRKHRERAVTHVKSMEAEGLVEMVPAGAGWRVYRGRP